MKKPQTVQAQCPACGETFEAVAAAAGQQGYCPNCGEIVTIPLPPPPPPITVKESRSKVGNWFIGLWVLSALMISLGTTPDSGGLFPLGCLLASILTIVWFSLLISYVRTIALNSERR